MAIGTNAYFYDKSSYLKYYYYYYIYTTKSIASVRSFVRPSKAILLADAGYDLQIYNLHAQAYFLNCTYTRIYMCVKNG